MIKRMQRGDKLISKERLLETLGECRRRFISIQIQATPFGPIDRACMAACEAIDDMAEIATGDRRHFWEKGGSAPHG